MQWTELYRDDDILVVCKPSGLATQADRNGEPGLYDLLRRDEPAWALHHRLDRPASGLVIFGKSRMANRALTEGFRDHTIERSYVAVLVGDAVSGRWDAPIEGKSARSDVTVLSSANGFTSVRMSLHTGRTHQLRRHAAMAGAPIAGDRRYGGSAARAWPRLALHAATLSLAHPVSGERLTFEAELPEDLAPLWQLASD